MADKDPEDKPSLELPSFGFGRTRNRAQSTEPEAAPEDTPSAPPTPTRMLPAVQTPVAPELDPALPDIHPAPVVSTREVTPAGPSARAADAPTSPSLSSSTQESSPVASPTQQMGPGPGDHPATPSAPKRESSLPTALSMPALPVIPALQAVLVVGGLIGLLAVLLTFASLKFCELASGTDSCGGPGLLLLLATVVVLTYLGASLLRGFGIADAGSTSFLAVALLTVMVMVFLLDVIYNWWMVLVVPPMSMAMYALSWWVTTSFVDTDDGRR